MNKRVLILGMLVMSVLLSAESKSQVYNYEDGETELDPDSIHGFYFGLNLGYYFANKATASVYNGYGYTRAGERNSFENSWLYRAIGPNAPAVVQDDVATAISDESGYPVTSDDYEFSIEDMPYQMTYTPSFMFGGHIRYQVNADLGIFLEGNGTFPTTVGEFTVSLNNVVNNSTGDYVRRYQIRGEEQRLVFNLGMQKAWGRNDKFKPYFEIGANSTFVSFEENIIQIGNYTRDLTVFYDNVGTIPLEARNFTGIGFGGFAGIGGQLRLGTMFTINFGYIASLEQIKLGDLVNSRSLQHNAIIRIIYM